MTEPPFWHNLPSSIPPPRYELTHSLTLLPNCLLNSIFSHSLTHSLTQVLVELAQLQDQEVGDGTTSVVIVAAELLKRANELVKKNIHPTVVMAGYRLACKEAVKFIKENLIVKADSLGADNLINAGRWLLTQSLTHSLTHSLNLCPHSTYVLTQLMSSLNLCPHSTYVLT